MSCKFVVQNHLVVEHVVWVDSCWWFSLLHRSFHSSHSDLSFQNRMFFMVGSGECLSSGGNCLDYGITSKVLKNHAETACSLQNAIMGVIVCVYNYRNWIWGSTLSQLMNLTTGCFWCTCWSASEGLVSVNHPSTFAISVLFSHKIVCLYWCARIKKNLNVMRCSDSRSAKSRETR